MYTNLASLGACVPDFISHPEKWRVFPLGNLSHWHYLGGNWRSLKESKKEKLLLKKNLTFVNSLVLAHHLTPNDSHQEVLFQTWQLLFQAEKEHSPGISKETCSSLASQDLYNIR